jgi:RecQ-mediated genome instability protein 1
MPPQHPLHDTLLRTLQDRNLPVNPIWLTSFLDTRPGPPPPLPALTSTAQFRLLASDITTTLLSTDPLDTLPAGINDVAIKQRILRGTVVVQVLDILDVGSSKWTQIEAIERVERGEEVRGREVIRTVNGAMEDDVEANDSDARVSATATASNMNNAGISTGAGHDSASAKLTSGPHKILIQDAQGTKVHAFELSKVPKLAISVSAGAVLPRNLSSNPAVPVPATDDGGMCIGCKIMLKPGTVVRRGMLMMMPETCIVLGGKVEAWDKKWKEGRKARLQAEIGQ